MLRLTRLLVPGVNGLDIISVRLEQITYGLSMSASRSVKRYVPTVIGTKVSSPTFLDACKATLIFCVIVYLIVKRMRLPSYLYEGMPIESAGFIFVNQFSKPSKTHFKELSNEA